MFTDILDIEDVKKGLATTTGDKRQEFLKNFTSYPIKSGDVKIKMSYTDTDRTLENIIIKYFINKNI